MNYLFQNDINALNKCENIEIHKNITTYYHMYHGDKSQMILHILLHFSDHRVRTKYIYMIDFYLLTIQKEDIFFDKLIHDRIFDANV